MYLFHTFVGTPVYLFHSRLSRKSWQDPNRSANIRVIRSRLAIRQRLGRNPVDIANGRLEAGADFAQSFVGQGLEAGGNKTAKQRTARPFDKLRASKATVAPAFRHGTLRYVANMAALA